MSIKINKVKNVKNLDLTRCDYDSKVGMIYGLNGSGKSTIKNIFRSLYQNDVLKKNFNRQKELTEVEISISGKDYIYNDGWDKEISGSKLHIFDNDFVNSNIYIDGKISSVQRSNLTQVVFGQENIKKYRELEKFSKKIYDTQEDYNRLISSFKASNEGINLYNLSKSINEVEQIISEKSEFFSNSSDLIQMHINKNIRDMPKSRVWLKDGTELQKNEVNCPMCGQSLGEEEIELFNEIRENDLVKKDYTKRKRRLTSEIENIRNIVENNRFSVGRKEFVRLKLHEINDSKELDWTSKISLEDNPTLKYMKESINKINNLISLLPAKFNKRDFTNIDEHINNSKIIYSKGIHAFKEIVSLLKKMKAMNKSFLTKQEDIKNNICTKFDKKINKINQDLVRYGVPYKLDSKEILDSGKTNAKKTGANLECTLHFVHTSSGVNVKEKELENTFSQGEKSIIAWILYINCYEEDFVKGANFIILDDPIASYDEYKRFPMIRSIKKIESINSNNKILVLTHEKSFVSLFSKQKIGVLYSIIDDEIKKTSLNDILSNELIENITCMQKLNKQSISEENVIEFLVRSRKLLEFHTLLSKGTDVMEDYVYKAFVNLSKLLHGETSRLFKKSIKNIYKVVNSYLNVKLIKNISINLDSIFVVLISQKQKTNLYSHRIIIEEYLRSRISKRKLKVFKDNCKSNGDEPTIGNLFSFVKNLGKLKEEIQVEISYSLPIVNTVYHPGTYYGLSVNDISKVNKQSVQRLIDKIVFDI